MITVWLLAILFFYQIVPVNLSVLLWAVPTNISLRLYCCRIVGHLLEDAKCDENENII